MISIALGFRGQNGLDNLICDIIETQFIIFTTKLSMRMKKALPTIQYSIQQAATWAGYSALFAYASVFLLSRGFSNSGVGYVVAGGSLLSALLQPIAGAFADKSRRFILHRLIVVISLVMMLSAGLLLVPGHSFWVMALLYGILVAFLQMVTPLDFSLGMYFINRGVKINFGIARGMGSLAYALLSYILGILTEKMSTDVVMVAVILLYSVLILSVITFHFKGVPEVPFSDTREHTRKTGSLSGFLKSHPSFAGVVAGVSLLFISHNIISNYMFQIVSHVGRGTAEMGTAITIAAVLEIPVLFLLSAINRFLRSGTLLKVSCVFFAIKALFIFLASNIETIYMAQCFQILGFGLYAGISVCYVNHTIEEPFRTRGQAFMTMSNTAGAVAGSLLGGWLLDLTSVRVMNLVSLATALLGAVIVLCSAQSGKKA